MNVFLKTLIICFVVSISYYFWLFLGKESYQGALDVNKTTVSKEQVAVNIPNENIKEEEPPKKPENKVKKVKIYFMQDDNTIRYVSREVNSATLEVAIKELLLGPTKYEKQKGIYSEIPADTKLMWVKSENGKIIVNLTRNFENGGGTKSIENRIKQLKLTVDNFGSKKPVYLYLDGKQVEYMGGEGIFIEQPLN